MCNLAKKSLLSTTAIILACSTYSTAFAAEWDVRVGGYFEAFTAYSSSDVAGFTGDDHDGFDILLNGEISFKPSITLDNGLTFGGKIVLEENGEADAVDEAYLFIDGSFGQVLLGSSHSAGHKMAYGAPDVTWVGVNSGSLTSFIPFHGPVAGFNRGDDVFRKTLGTTFIENDGNDKDAGRITYYTPRFAGFQLGVSYARDESDNPNPGTDCSRKTCEYFDIGANYVRSFGEYSIGISGRYGIGDNNRFDDLDPEIWGLGAVLKYGGFTIGGSFAEQNNGRGGGLDGEAYDLGASYTTGPWAFSFTYFNGQNADNEHIGTGFKEELEIYKIGATYDLGPPRGGSFGEDVFTGYSSGGGGSIPQIKPKLKLSAYIAKVDFDEERGDFGGANFATGDDVDGFVIGTSLRVSF